MLLELMTCAPSIRALDLSHPQLDRASPFLLLTKVQPEVLALRHTVFPEIPRLYRHLGPPQIQVRAIDPKFRVQGERDAKPKPCITLVPY